MSFYLSVPLGCFSVRIICGFSYHRNAVSASLGSTPTSISGRHRAAAAPNTFCFRIARQELVSRSVALGAGSDLGVGLSLGLGVGWLVCGRGLWGFLGCLLVWRQLQPCPWGMRGAGGAGHGRRRGGGTLAAALPHLAQPRPFFLALMTGIHLGQSCSCTQREERAALNAHTPLWQLGCSVLGLLVWALLC